MTARCQMPPARGLRPPARMRRWTAEREADRVAPRNSASPQLLRSINGRAVRTPSEFDAEVRRLSPGDAVSLRVVDRELGE